MSSQTPACRVLIVDDQRDMRHVLRAGLETLNCNINVVDVPSGEEAILVISRYPIDLLVTDIRLPGISGLELKERAQIRNPSMKFILITGMTEPKIRREITNANADAYFFKPVELTDFLDAARRCLGLDKLSPLEEISAEPALVQTHSLSELLARLRGELEAISIVLLDDRGQVMAQAGELPGYLAEPVSASSMMSALNAAGKASLSFGASPPADLIFFSSKAHDLFLTHVGQTFGLLSIVPIGVWSQSQQWKLLQAMRAAARNLLESLDRLGVPVEPEGEAPIEPAIPEKELEEPVEKIPELEAIFRRASKAKLKEQDIDAFWESLATESSGDITRSDTISFEQAQQLGLAPED